MSGRRPGQAAGAALAAAGLPTATAAQTGAGETVLWGLRATVALLVVLIAVYTARHLLFTLNRLFGHQRHPYLDVDTADWPSVTVVVPAHNEEDVIGTALDALLDVDYPRERYCIVVVDDRSADRTGELIEDYAARFPGLVRAVRRTEGTPGKAAVLKEVSEQVDSEIMIVFDADYIPGRGLIKQLVAPFFDAEVGAVMGRVVPHNTERNLLTRLLDLERAGGYQVDQQARMNLHLVPQYGGSVGGARVSALRAVGGWRVDTYAEDTDLTYRLLLHGFKTVYENRCECYEEVPEVWQERNRQIMRWAKGHNQTAVRYLWPTLSRARVGLLERIDAVLLLGVYGIAPLIVVGFLAAYGLYLAGAPLLAGGALTLIAFTCFGALGNFAAFYEIAAAMHIDGSRRRLRLLPLNFLNFLVSTISITRACFSLVTHDYLLKRELRWEKTARYTGNGNGRQWQRTRHGQGQRRRPGAAPMSWPVAFWLSAVLVCVAPFLPALIEWRTRSDAAPLVVLREQDTNIRHFAQSFFDRIQDFFEREGIDPLRPPVPYRGDFRPGEPFQFLGRATRPQWPDAVRRRRIVPELVIATGDLLLEGGYVYEQELYCGGQLYAGSHSTFRAVYAGTDLILADSCTVARWLHSQGHVHIGADCAIYGRVSSTSSITLGAGTRFERLNARQVRFASDNPVDQAAAVPQGARVAWDPPPLRALDGRTLKCEGSLDVPGAVEVDHDLVATAALSLGPDSRVAGKLKAGTRLEIGDGCTIDGALVAQGPLHVGRGCRVDGPVISEQAVVIAAGSVIGAPDAPTTVTAPYVFAEAGCEVCGTLWATVEGRVVAPEAAADERGAGM